MALSEMNYVDGGGGNLTGYTQYGISITADTTIDVGFEPSEVFIILHAPNYQRPLYLTYWTENYSEYQYQASWGSNSNYNANRYSMPYTSSGAVIKSISGSVVTWGYNSSMGNNQTFDIIAFPTHS